MTQRTSSAFTLIELIIVITIIGILVVTVALDFNSVRSRQQLSLMADQALALMQQARGDVTSGKVRSEESLTSSGSLETEKIYLCEGGYFAVDATPLLAMGDYDAESESCDFSSFETELYGLSTGAAFISSVEVDGASVESVWALYTPPEGELAFYSESGEAYTGETILRFDHSSEIGLAISLELSPFTDLVQLNLGDDEA